MHICIDYTSYIVFKLAWNYYAMGLIENAHSHDRWFGAHAKHMQNMFLYNIGLTHLP